ncbi:Golgi-associated RAB2 interactor protein 5B [Manis javanica]|uniref:Golgi-associated RAB2 interactor protein 5B n=1 Tax=Manis javanica TaxID=9974 RepID=UPI003C6D0A41
MNWLWNIKGMETCQGPPAWVPTLGELQKALQKGEYLPLCPLPMFESNFVQVTNRGAPVCIHHKTHRVTMGVAASLPALGLPDILLIAQPSEGREGSSLALTRMIPLDLSHLCVHDLSTRRLKLHLVTGRYYYLELDAPDGEGGFLFDCWVRLINLLWEPADTWTPRTLPTPLSNLARTATPASTWSLQDQPQSRRSVMIIEPTFPYKMQASQRQKKAKPLKQPVRSQAVGDSMPLIWSKLKHDTRKKSAEKRSQPGVSLNRPQAQIQASKKPSITSRTTSGVMSNTTDHVQPSPQAAVCSSDCHVGMVRGGFVETPIHCISDNGHDAPLLGSCDHLDKHLWQKDTEERMNPESRTLSSSPLCPRATSPHLYLSAPSCSFPRRTDKARPLGSAQRLQPPPSQKIPSTVPAASRKVPFLLDHSRKVSAAHAPSHEAPAVPATPQKAPVAPVPSRKAPPVTAISQKAPDLPAPFWKTPLAFSKAVPNRKSSCIPTPSQKALTSLTQYQLTLDPANLGMLPMESHGAGVLERSGLVGKPESPRMLVGTQETYTVEARTQKTFLELPSPTTQRESEEVLTSKTQEISLDSSKARGRLEDRVHRVKEEIPVGIPGFKSKEMGQQKRVKTQEPAVEEVLQEHRRPFLVESLALAKLMFMADSQELPSRLAVMEAEVCRQPRGGSQETAEMTDQHITATAGLSLEILSHTLLETENMGDTAPKEDTTEEELGGSTLRRLEEPRRLEERNVGTQPQSPERAEESRVAK